MSICTAGRFLTAALVLAGLLHGCASAPNASTPSASLAAPLVRGLPLPEIVTPGGHSSGFGMWMYTAQLYGNDAEVYKRKGLSLTFFESIPGLSAPQGTEATVNGWWYVTNGGQSNVVIYRSTNKGPKGPESSLNDSGQIPSNVAVTPNRRLVAVSNTSTIGGGAGSVSVYLNRQTEPSRNLTYGTDPLQGTGITIDHRGNCYWSFNDPNTGSGSIVEFAGCNGRGALVVPSIPSSGGIAFDQRDDLYYVDRTTGIYECKRTSHCRLFATGFGLPVNINFDHKSKYLWVADATGYIDAIDLRGKVYRYPAEGGPTNPPFGIAPAPGG
jgi:hypothetical protein